MKELYYTQSTNLASYLVAHEFEIVGSRKTNRVTTFYFEKTDALHDCVRKYNSDTELKKFIAAFKKVKQSMK